MPAFEYQKALIDIYIKAFGRTPLLMNFDEPEALAYGTSQGAGWRFDCLGDLRPKWSHMLDFYPQQIARTGIGEVWRRSPVSIIDTWFEDDEGKRIEACNTGHPIVACMRARFRAPLENPQFSIVAFATTPDRRSLIAPNTVDTMSSHFCERNNRCILSAMAQMSPRFWASSKSSPIRTCTTIPAARTSGASSATSWSALASPTTRTDRQTGVATAVGRTHGTRRHGVAEPPGTRDGEVDPVEAADAL